MKRLYLIFASWFLCLFLVVSSCFVSFADVNSLMIRTDSNALMTMELDDSDYSVMPFSSLANINNTVDLDSVFVFIRLINEESGMYEYQFPSVNASGGFRYYVPNGYSLDSYGFRLEKGALPVPGKYLFQLDFASDVSVEYNAASLVTTRKKNNVTEESASVTVKNYSQFNSGDIFTELVGQFGSINSLRLSYRLTDVLPSGSLIAGYVKIAFSETDEAVDVDVVSTVDSEADYQAGVSSSLSDLSSSVDTMTDEISGITEAIQDLQGAMEPHYSNVLTQLHHITEQLHAIYDQIYNNIHLKEYALWQDIKTAIENIDLEVNVNLDKLKTSIDNMSQAVQNKLQSVTDTITGGYNNSGMQEDNNELSGALDELDNVEQEVLDDVNGYIEGFEYPSFDGISSGIIGALSFFGGLLHSIFLGMGEFGLIITFSLTMIFVLIIVGYHRIRS